MYIVIAPKVQSSNPAIYIMTVYFSSLFLTATFYATLVQYAPACMRSYATCLSLHVGWVRLLVL